jgi:phage shock protein A
MREECKRRRQQMDQLREKLDEARRKIARLETQQQIVRYLNARCDLLELLALRI